MKIFGLIAGCFSKNFFTELIEELEDYDIIAYEQRTKVSRNVFKICKKYLTNIQKSVFEGNLTELNYMRLKIKLNKYLRIDRDEKWLEKEFLGVMDDKTSNFFK